MSTNRAIIQDGYNKDDPLATVKMITKPVPKAGPGQVVVCMTLRPINPTDFISLRNGTVGGNGKGVFGSEGCGVIHEVGSGVSSVRKGQRVVAITGLEVFKGNGSFQDYILLDENLVWPVPEGMDEEVACQFVINPWTSYSMLKDLKVPKGEYVIQSAANSTLGKQVITLAKHWGIKTINLVRREEAKAELLALGADEVIVSSSEDVVSRVKEITGGKLAYGALDAVSGTTAGTLAASVRSGGDVFVYGVLSGTTIMVSTFDLWRGIKFTGWIIYNNVMPSAEKSHAVAKEVAPLVMQGILPVAKCETYKLEEFKQAMERAEDVGAAKKILLAS
jgi:NADPH:quinone reductase-like Zn-dependent oxidoreductase